MIRGIYLDPIEELSFLTVAMNMSFTSAFDPPTDNIHSVGLMVQLSLDPDLRVDSEKAEQIEEIINEKVEEMDAGDEELVYTTLGMHTISGAIMDAAMDSMFILAPIAVITLIVILAIVYRSGFDLFISLFALILAVVWVYGFGMLMGFIFNPLIIAVPVLVMGLGIDFGIHITMRYREELAHGKSIDDAMIETIASVGMALLLATFTTVVAFLANALSPIPTLSEFGIMCAFGILASFIIMVTFVPAAKVMRDTKRQKKGRPVVGIKPKEDDDGENEAKNVKIKPGALDRTLAMGALGSEKHPVGVLVIALVITGLGFYSTMVIPTTFDFKDFLPEGVPIAQELTFMLEEYDMEDIMGGDVRILIKGNVASVECLRAMEDAIDNMGDDNFVVKDDGKAEVHSAFSLMWDYANYDTGGSDYKYDSNFSAMYYGLFDTDGRVLAAIPDSSSIAPLYDWLYDNATIDITGFVHVDNETGAYDATILKIEVDVSDDEEDIYELKDSIERDVEPLETSTAVERVIVTSGPILTQVIMDALNSSQITSIMITLIVAFLAMGIVYYLVERSFMLGVLTTLPMIFCIAWLFGTMYLLDLSLNVMTITIASLTVGLGITYGIHIAHRFAEDLREIKNTEKAMRSTVIHVGRALFGAAATTIAGFGILVFTILPPIQQFGGLTALAILFSFLSSVFVLPSILVLWARNRLKKSGGEENGGEEETPASTEDELKPEEEKLEGEAQKAGELEIRGPREVIHEEEI